MPGAGCWVPKSKTAPGTRHPALRVRKHVASNHAEFRARRNAQSGHPEARAADESAAGAGGGGRGKRRSHHADFQQLPRPRQSPGDHRGSRKSGTRLRIRARVGALHLRHADHPPPARAAHREFFATEDTILYGSCWNANEGLFQTIALEQDAIISDELNHASIIDGVRLSKARKERFKNRDMNDPAAPSKPRKTRATKSS